MSDHQESRRPVFGTFRVPRSVYYGVLEPKPEESVPGLLIAFHGYGQSANSFLAPLSVASERNWLVVAPQGPNMFYWQQEGSAAVGFTWLTRYQRENSLHDNQVYLTELVDRVRREYTFDERRVFALGFSQGCAMAFRFAASGAVRIRGLIACAGDLPADVEESLGQLEAFPVRIAHGREDAVVPIDKAEHAESALKQAGFPVTTDYFDAGHELPAESIEAALNWIECIEGR